MNRRLCVWVVLILTGLILTGLCGVCVGQTLPGGIPASAQSDVTQSAADIQGINQYIAGQFTILNGNDAVAQSAARKALIAQLGRGAQSSYFVAFSKAWTSAAAAALTKNPPPSVGVRLNIAIVTDTLTDHGAVIDPQTLVIALIGDKAPCVSLWGIKAARPLLMVMLQQPRNPGFALLTSSIVTAVKNHSESDIAGLVTIDAYAALVFDSNHSIPGLTPQQLAPLVPPLTGPILDILEIRLKQYQNGIKLPGGKLGAPQSPGAEHSIGTFLSTNYPLVALPLQQRIVQDLVNLLTFIGERAPLYQNGRDSFEVFDTLRYDSSPLKVIVPSAASGLTWLLQLQQEYAPKVILDHTKLVYGLVHADPGFIWLTPPPGVVPIEAPPPEPPKTAPGTPTSGTPAR